MGGRDLMSIKRNDERWMWCVLKQDIRIFITNRKDDRGGIAAIRIAYIYLFFFPLDVVL
jgi:hypothetical protein